MRRVLAIVAAMSCATWVAVGLASWRTAARLEAMGGTSPDIGSGGIAIAACGIVLSVVIAILSLRYRWYGAGLSFAVLLLAVGVLAALSQGAGAGG